TACPSGVEYGDLLAPFRAQAENTESRPWLDRMTRKLVHLTLPYPRRFRLAAMSGRLGLPFARFLPARLRAMLDLLPAQLPAAQPAAAHTPAQGKRRARVALLAGCAQQVLAPDINQATLRVLARNGVEVIVPQGQGCCGSLAAHTGEADQARRFARQNMAAFPTDVDAIITNAAGCGSGMHEYPLLFAGTEHEQAAQEFSARVQDVSQFLAGLGLMETPTLAKPCKVAYHDACHLAHAQGITAAPRKLLNSVENLTLVPIAESELCCGSAGVYNIEQPELAHQIGARKAGNILLTQADLVTTGNIGCLVQIEKHLQAQGSSIP
ncbi:MAG: heterodisulfide reductase-related iron-sulfur binding cluster, partial [Litorilinea sp.]